MSTVSARKRLQRDLTQWRASNHHFPNIAVSPLEDNLFEWHFNIFFPGIPSPLHGFIEFSKDYPFTAPKLFFSSYLPHPQVSVDRKRYVVCLDMLENLTSERFYSGWSTAYSVESIFAQIQAILFEIGSVIAPDGVVNDHDEDAQQVLKQWRKCRCKKCGHDGRNSQSFVPIQLVIDTQPIRPTTDIALWEKLYGDVEQVVFSFLYFEDLAKLYHVNQHIREVLTRRNIHHWATVSCYHSHRTFGDFMESKKQSHVFGIGFETEYWENSYYGPGGVMKQEKKLNNIHVSVDVLSAQAFKSGVKFSMWKDFRFSHFLPLYLNETHGAMAMKMARTTMAQCYGKSTFDPVLALNFLAKLMNTTVVSLMREIATGEEVHLFTSIKALQSYMYFYHLLLGFAVRYPQITSHAKREVQKFMTSERSVNKSNFPDLGEFLIYLTIVDVNWDDIGPFIIHEGYVRNSKWTLEKYPHLIANHSTTATSCVRLRQQWQSSIIGRRLFMFQVFFLENVCGYGGASSATHGKNRQNRVKLQARLEEFNQSLGQVKESLGIKLQRACREIFHVDDYLQFYNRIGLPCPSASKLCHSLREAMLESDWKGYQRFTEVSGLSAGKGRQRKKMNHEKTDLCLCAGTLFDLNDRDKTDDEKKEIEAVDDIDKNVVDIAFSVDCFSGVYPFLEKLKTDILTMSAKLVSAGFDVRFAVVGYRDHGGTGDWSDVTKVFDFSDANNLKKNLAKLTPGGGGRVEGVAESWYQVVRLKWRPHSIKVCINVIGLAVIDLSDTYLCNDWPGGLDPVEQASELLNRRVGIYTVGNQGWYEERSRSFYQGTAHMTGGLYLKLDAVASLSDLVVQSTMEEKSLVDVVPMVANLLERFRETNPYATRDQLAYLIWRELVENGVTTDKVALGPDLEVEKASMAVSETRTLKEAHDSVVALTSSGTGGGAGGGPAGMVPGAYYSPTMGAQLAPATVPGSTNVLEMKDGVDASIKTRLQEKVRVEKEKNAPNDPENAISLAQTLRCVLRAERELDRREWVEKGCLYRMEKYSNGAARKRYAAHGKKFDARCREIKYHGSVRVGTRMEYIDFRTGKVHAAAVVSVNPSMYSITLNVPDLRESSVSVPLSSLRIEEEGTNLRNGAYDAACAAARLRNRPFNDRPRRQTRTTRMPTTTRKRKRVIPQNKKKMTMVKLSGLGQQLNNAAQAMVETSTAKTGPKTLRQKIEGNIVVGNCPMIAQALEAVTPPEARAICVRQDNDPNGKTLLHVAAVSGKVKVVDLLLEFGADPAIVDADGKTPIECVRCELSNPGLSELKKEKHREVNRRLRQAMQDPESRHCRQGIWVNPEPVVAVVQASTTTKKRKKKKSKKKSTQDVATDTNVDVPSEVGQGAGVTSSQTNVPQWMTEKMMTASTLLNAMDGENSSSNAPAPRPKKPPKMVRKEEEKKSEPEMVCVVTISNLPWGVRASDVAQLIGQVGLESIDGMPISISPVSSTTVQATVTIDIPKGQGNLTDTLLSVATLDEFHFNGIWLQTSTQFVERQSIPGMKTNKKKQKKSKKKKASTISSSSSSSMQQQQQQPVVQQTVVHQAITPYPIGESDLVVKSALCVIPPEELWAPIQVIRQLHDKAYRRWMPHINVMYPFVPFSHFDRQVNLLQNAFRTAGMTSFRVELSRFAYFDRMPRGGESDPELYVYLKARVVGGNSRAWQQLIDVLERVYPGCFAGGKGKRKKKEFTAHLTVGQMVRSRVRQFVDDLNRNWVPCVFEVGGVCLISRRGYNDPFQVNHVVRF